MSIASSNNLCTGDDVDNSECTPLEVNIENNDSSYTKHSPTKKVENSTTTNLEGNIENNDSYSTKHSPTQKDVEHRKLHHLHLPQVLPIQVLPEK